MGWGGGFSGFVFSRMDCQSAPSGGAFPWQQPAALLRGAGNAPAGAFAPFAGCPRLFWLLETGAKALVQGGLHHGWSPARFSGSASRSGSAKPASMQASLARCCSRRGVPVRRMCSEEIAMQRGWSGMLHTAAPCVSAEHLLYFTAIWRALSRRLHNKRWMHRLSAANADQMAVS